MFHNFCQCTFYSLMSALSRVFSEAEHGGFMVRAGFVRQRYPKFTQDHEHQAEESKGQAPGAKNTQYAATKTHK